MSRVLSVVEAEVASTFVASVPALFSLRRYATPMNAAAENEAAWDGDGEDVCSMAKVTDVAVLYGEWSTHPAAASGARRAPRNLQLG